MGRKHAFAVSALLTFAGVAGAYATTQTLDIGESAQQQAESAVPANVISERKQKLDQWEKSLQVAAAKKPPKLPKAPKFPQVQIPKATPFAFNSLIPTTLQPRANSASRASSRAKEKAANEAAARVRKRPTAPSEPAAPAAETPVRDEQPREDVREAAPPPAAPSPAEEEVIYVRPDPVIKYVQPGATGGTERSKEETDALKQQVKAEIAPLEAQKDALRLERDQVDEQLRQLRIEKDALRKQREGLEGDARAQIDAQIAQLEQQEQTVKDERDVISAEMDRLKAEIEAVWQAAFGG